MEIIYYIHNNSYISAFQCVLHSTNFDIPSVIPAEYVSKAESIVSSSYDHSETFSLVSMYLWKL